MNQDRHPSIVTHAMRLDYYSARLEPKGYSHATPLQNLISYKDWQQIRAILSPLEEFGMTIGFSEYEGDGISTVTITPKSIEAQNGELAFSTDMIEKDRLYAVEHLSELELSTLIARIKEVTHIELSLSLKPVADDETIRKNFYIVDEAVDMDW